MERPTSRVDLAIRLFRVSRVLAWLSVALGAAVLVGYATESERMVQIAPSLPPMYPNAAILLIGCGTALIAQNSGYLGRLAAWIGALGVTGLASVSLLLHVVDAPRTVVETLFPRGGFVEATTPIGGRPAVETCMAFLLLGVGSILLIARSAPRSSQVVAVAALFVGMSAIVGFVLGVDRRTMGETSSFVGMALHTAVGITALALALLFARPSGGFVAQLLDGGLVGAVSRQMTVVVLAVPLVLLVIQIGILATAVDPKLAQSAYLVVEIGLLGAAVLLPAAVISRVERQLEARLEAVRRQSEGVSEVDIVVESITAEMAVTQPSVPSWDVGMRYQPAVGHLAGDSVQMLHNEHSGRSVLVVLDVAGHGAEPAIIAYGVRAHIAALVESGVSLVDIATSVNRKLLRRRTIATAMMMAFESGSTEIEVLNAGHPAAVHVRGRRLDLWAPNGPLLGLRNAEYHARRVDIVDADLVVVVTDGVTESRGSDGVMFGDAALAEVVLSYRSESVDVIAAACLAAALGHAGSRLSDDSFVLALRKQG